MKIAVIESLQLDRDYVLEQFDALRCEVDYYDNKPENDEEIIRRCSGAEIVVLVNTPLRREVIEKLKNLKMVAVSFTGYDHVDIEACGERGIVVSNVPEYSTTSVAELVFGMIISLMRQIPQCDSALREGKGSTGLMGTELMGKTMGVIGTGKIGKRVCEIALCFGMRVLAYSRTEKEEIKSKGVRYTSLEELLRESDVVSIHLPLNRQTEKLIGERELSMMKSGAILVNAARGKIVDTTALVKELERGRIYACLDVFDIEPPLPESHPVIKTKNTLLAPHVGYYTVEALQRRLKVTVENIKAFMEGKPVNVVTQKA
jgi:D-3-phosphoglycerate dehydrogenase